MTKKGTRFKVFICNVLISVLCLLSIGAYFILPFWKVDLSMNVSAEMLNEMMQSQNSEENSGENSGENAGETDEKSMDFSQVVGKDGIDLTLSIQLNTSDVLSSLSGDATATVQTILNDNVNKIVDQLNEPLQKMARAAMQVVAKQTISDLLHSQIEDIYNNEKTSEEVKQAMQNAGINDEYIDSKTQELFNALYNEDASVDTVANTAISILEESFEKMETADPSTQFHLSQDDKTKVREEVSNALSSIAAEDGSIDMENLIANILLQAFGEDKSGNENGNESGEVSVKGLAVALEQELLQTPETTGNATEELKQTLRAKIMEMIGEETVQSIADVLKIVSYVILFTFFTWAYLILKILLKLTASNNAIKLKLPIWLGSIPFWVLYLIPTVLISLLKNPPASMADMFGAETAAAMSSFNITFFTCAFVSFIVGVALCLLSMFFYSRQRKILKKYKKGLLKDTVESDEFDNDLDE
jgi:hypothetical protein